MPRVYGNSPGKPNDFSDCQFSKESAVYSRSTGSPEIVTKRCLRSAGELLLDFPSDMMRSQRSVYSERARRNEVTAKNTNNKATATERAISQCATSRVHARNAEFSQPNAKIANMAP